MKCPNCSAELKFIEHTDHNDCDIYVCNMAGCSTSFVHLYEESDIDKEHIEYDFDDDDETRCNVCGAFSYGEDFCTEHQ
jgi:hypothetical protein